MQMTFSKKKSTKNVFLFETHVTVEKYYYKKLKLLSMNTILQENIRQNYNV